MDFFDIRDQLSEEEMMVKDTVARFTDEKILPVIRECFEEAGVLLATREDGTLLPLTDPVRRARFATWRERLNGGEKGAFEAMCQAEGLRLAADRLGQGAAATARVTSTRRHRW